MNSPKFSDKRGFCTSYAHRCGYMDSARVGTDDSAILMGAEGAVYYVQCFVEVPRVWDCFDATSKGRKDARKRFMELVKKHKAKRFVAKA